MSTFPSAENYLAETRAALESFTPLRRAIRTNAQVYGGIYPFALTGCVVAAFYDSVWIRSFAHFLVAACLFTAWRMRRTLGDLARAYRVFPLGASSVLGNHRTLNYAALALLSYAWFAILRSWPAPSFAVLLAAFINFTHYCGYPDRPVDR